MKNKPFQREDLARLALHDGAILGWHTGLGKTWALFEWPLLKCGFLQPSAFSLQPCAPVLIVAPGDLHQQICEEGRKIFKIAITPLDSQEAFSRLVTGVTPGGRPLIAPGFYITSYTQLSVNGVIAMPDVDKWQDPGILLEWLSLKIEAVAEFFQERGKIWTDEYDALAVRPIDTIKVLENSLRGKLAELGNWSDRTGARNEEDRLYKCYNVLKNLMCDKPVPNLSDLSIEQQQWVTREYLRRYIRDCEAGLGTFKSSTRSVGGAPDSGPAADNGPLTTDRKIKCLWSPSLSDLCWNAFDCVVVDEGVRIKGADTLIGGGVRQLDPEYRLVLTATAIKNRLPDIFWLLWWALGGKDEPHARFPYRGTIEDQGAFSKTFLVSERNLSKEAKSDKLRKFQKLTAQVCNVHRLWKLLAPGILRRRKEDVGEQIVPRLRHVIRCPMGGHQAGVYQYHLDAVYLDKHGQPAPGAKLQALRVAAAAPHSALLEAQCGKRPSSRNRQVASVSSDIKPAHRSSSDYIPKFATVLNLVEQVLRRREQVVIFSPFHDPLDALSARLREAGVRHHVLDGRTSQKQRGKVSAKFKAGPRPSTLNPQPIPVLLAGVECMAEGHNFNLCSNVILLAYSWAYDKFEQAISRVHRLTSPAPVNVYSVICDGTVDRKLESSIEEKGNASDLVLDGRLMGERSEELNLAELIQIAEREFDAETKTIDEARLQAEWPGLRARLAEAMAAWPEPSTAAQYRPERKPEQRVETKPNIVPVHPAPTSTSSDTQLLLWAA